MEYLRGRFEILKSKLTFAGYLALSGHLTTSMATGDLPLALALPFTGAYLFVDTNVSKSY